MPITINSNISAAIARDNLSFATQQLQSSLNRLSSGSKIVNASDDAGGLAVSLKLSASANRDTMLAQTLGDASSFAQTQDGALAVAGSIMDRISQLKTLYSDPTKNSSDLANYNDEFTQLQQELNNVSSETFNGISLFGAGSLNIATSDDLGTASAITVAQQDLLSNGGFTTLSDSFADLSNWTTQTFGIGASVTTPANKLHLAVNTGLVSASTKESFSGPLEINTSYDLSSTNGIFQVQLGNTTLAMDQTFGSTGTHSLKIDVDQTGKYSVYVDGASSASSTGGGIDTAIPSQLTFSLVAAGGGGTDIGATTVQSLAPAQNQADVVATGADLGAVSLTNITSAIQELATMRAENGAEQSRIQFASSLLSSNQTNLEAAVSRIKDVDVAAETTNLAKWNVLVQAGTSMLSQANLSTNTALKLLGD